MKNFKKKVLRKEKEACGQRLLKEEIEKHGAAANIGKTNRPLTIRNSTHTHTHSHTRNLYNNDGNGIIASLIELIIEYVVKQPEGQNLPEHCWIWNQN